MRLLVEVMPLGVALIRVSDDRLHAEQRLGRGMELAYRCPSVA